MSCVCVSVITLAATLNISTLKMRYTEVYLRFLTCGFSIKLSIQKLWCEKANMQMNMYSSLAFPWTKGSIKRLPTVPLSVGSKLELHTLRTESLLIYFPVNSHICPRMYIQHMGYIQTHDSV